MLTEYHEFLKDLEGMIFDNIGYSANSEERVNGQTK